MIDSKTDSNLQHLSRRQVMLGSAALLGAGAMSTVTPQANAQPGGPPSPYTATERERRWAALRAMMSEQGIDCLVVPNLNRLENLTIYNKKNKLPSLTYRIFPRLKKT
ncbi:MAG: hypothetical protein P8M72_07540 [Gammaproteobacteria bacterium]|nr:hypothetical protein [Gammaproteobacteria bacterium]